MYASNLVNVTQNFLSPEMVNRLSRSIGESSDKTQGALKSVIPFLLMGIVNKGETYEGAEGLVKLVNKDGFEGEKVSNFDDENYLAMGSDAVRNIFGGNVDQIASNLGQTTGLNSGGVKKLLTLAAPLVMGLLGKKMRREALGPEKLQTFLAGERTTISNMLPDGLEGKLKVTTSLPGEKSTPKTGESAVKRIQDDVQGESVWIILALLVLGILALVWWYTGTRNLTDVRSDPQIDVMSN